MQRLRDKPRAGTGIGQGPVAEPTSLSHHTRKAVQTTSCRRVAGLLIVSSVMLLLATYAEAAKLKSVQSGTAMSAGNGTVTVPITPVDPAKSFLLFQTRHSSNRPTGSMVRGRIASGISFDAQSGSNTTNVSSLSWSHTIGGGAARKLVVGVSVEDDVSGNETVTGITYNGVSLNFAQAVTVATGFVARVEIWYLDEANLPPSGSFTVQVTTTGLVNEINAGAVSIGGAMAGPPEASATNTNTSNATITTAITTFSDGAWLIDVVGSGNGGSYTPAAGQTERWDTSASSGTGACSTKEVATAGPSSMSQTHSTTSNRTAHVVIAVAPATSSSSTLEFARVSDQTFGIALDSVTSQVFSAVTTASLNHTIGAGTNRRLIVCTGVEAFPPGTVTGVTYNGVALSQDGFAEVDAGQRVEMWSLLEANLPATGTYQVQVTYSQASDPGVVVISLEGVAQQPAEATATNTCTSCSTLSTNITTLTDGAWVLSNVGNGQSGTYTHGSGQIERWDQNPTSAVHSGSTKVVATAGLTNIQDIASVSANRQAHFIAAFAPAPPPPVVDIQWSVVEFESGVNVQRGEVGQTATTINVPIGAVADISQAFVTWSKTPGATEGGWDSDDPIVGELTSPTNLQFRATGANSSHTIWWQVIEFTNPGDISVQKGSIVTMVGGTTSATAILSPAVDVNKTFVLVGFRTSGTGADVGRRMLRAELTDSTTITIDRSVAGAGDDIDEIVWQAVELKDGSTVQRGSENFASGAAQKVVIISPVDINRAVAFASVQSGGGQNMGRSAYTGDDIIGVGSVTMGLASTSITMDRANTAASCDIGWFVVQWRSSPRIIQWQEIDPFGP